MDIVEKIKKLIALGTNNTNESEMAAALAKAAELALRNNLDIEQIKNESEDSGDDVGMFPVDDKPAASLSGGETDPVDESGGHIRLGGRHTDDALRKPEAF